MNDGIMVIAVFALVIIAALATSDTNAVDRKEDAYLLEMGVPHCVVFKYECELAKEGGSDGQVIQPESDH
jgi:hypothetical protein